MSNQQKTLILIDGHALAYRAYFGMPDTFQTPSGEKTNAVYGFTNMILAVWKEYEPDYFIVTFDLGDTFRHEMYSEYKGTREKMPDDLSHQISRIEQLVSAFNMPVFTKERYEADDLLGTLAYQAAEQGIRALIVTGDRDTFQLVRPNVNVVISGRRFEDRQLYDEAAIEKRYELSPTKLIDLKALMGDSSDNIPGVKGIGEKTGTKLLKTYDSLDDIYANLDKIAKSTRTKLENGRENAYLSRDLGRIITDIPGVKLKLAEGRTTDFDLVEVANLFVELNFNTIFNRIPGAPQDKSPEDIATITPQQAEGSIKPDGNYQTITTITDLENLVNKLQQSDILAVDVETDSTDEVQTNLVGIAISPTTKHGYYIPLKHGSGTPKVYQANMFETTPQETSPAEPQLALETVQKMLAPLLRNSSITKYMHNAKFDMVVLQRHGMPVKQPIFDTMVASWLTNNAPQARHGLKDLTLQELNIQMTRFKELVGKAKEKVTIDKIPIEEVTPYASADVDMTLRLADLMIKRLKSDEGQAAAIFESLEMPLIYVLADMELTGIKIDVAILKQISTRLTSRLNELEEVIYAEAGQSFNVNSTQQLSDILFTKLSLPTTGIKKTKSGHYSTAAATLETLRGTHRIIDLVEEHRHLNKLQNTYVDALPALVNPQTGRIHTNYNQIGISTGRLSSADPNLQNIPIRDPQGREIRQAFVARPGWKLIAADYSQVELRILAHMADDPGLKEAFANDEDIHAATAAKVLGIDINEVDKDQRRIAKTVNFGLVYGQGAFGLAQSTGMSREEAQTFINTYFEKYAGVKEYIDTTKKQAAEAGYTETLFGRRRDFSHLASLTGPQRARAEREAINMPIQGTAADIMKQAMINIYNALQAENLQAKMLLQVHDEVVLETPDVEVAKVAHLVEQTMIQAYQLSVPLKVDVEMGQNWLEMAPYVAQVH